MRIHVLIAALLLLIAIPCFADDSFRPENGATFDVRVQDYEIDGAGLAAKTENFILPIEQEAIKAVMGNGFAYHPGGGARYNIKASVLCATPRAAAEGNMRTIFAYDANEDWYGLGALPSDVKVYSDALDQLDDNQCASIMLVTVFERTSAGMKIVHRDRAAIASGDTFGCPMNSCGPVAMRSLAQYLSGLFR